MDLFLATILISLISLWAMIVGFRLGQRSPNRSQLVVQISVLVVSSFYFVFLWNRPLLTLCLPHTALIVLANWHPLMGSFFAGIYLASRRIGRLRRLIVGPGTLLLAGYSIVAPVLGRAPVCEPSQATGPLISQTTPYTCSAAAAASLLQLHGIAATESEMAELCLTRDGTHWMGVYRGLKMMTQESAWDVVVQPFSREAVMMLNDSPAMLSININTDLIDALEDHGFCGHAGHSVLALGSRGNIEVMVFDPCPAYGIECWNEELLSWVSGGVILRLVSRYGAECDGPVKMRISQATREYDEFVYASWYVQL